MVITVAGGIYICTDEMAACEIVREPRRARGSICRGCHFWAWAGAEMNAAEKSGPTLQQSHDTNIVHYTLYTNTTDDFYRQLKIEVRKNLFICSGNSSLLLAPAFCQAAIDGLEAFGLQLK